MSEASADAASKCPKCQQDSGALTRIEAGMRLRLSEQGITDVPDEVCKNCFQTLNSQISTGATLRREMEMKEQHKAGLYRSRMTMVKNAKVLVGQKHFSEAAIMYEKYLRVLEMAFEVQAGELKPELFSAPSKQQELTVIAGVYWDLLNIYDTSNRYGDRQAKVALKLADFARFTPLFGSIARQAERKIKKSKNPEAYKLFLRESNARRPRCFIAGSAFNDQPDIAIDLLCAFRELRLRQTPLGRVVIFVYENLSPYFAFLLDVFFFFKPPIRYSLAKLANTAFIKNCLKEQPNLAQFD